MFEEQWVCLLVVLLLEMTIVVRGHLFFIIPILGNSEVDHLYYNMKTKYNKAHNDYHNGIVKFHSMKGQLILRNL